MNLPYAEACFNIAVGSLDKWASITRVFHPLIKIYGQTFFFFLLRCVYCLSLSSPSFFRSSSLKSAVTVINSRDTRYVYVTSTILQLYNNTIL